MAHMKAASSLAIAVITVLRFLPFAISRRNRGTKPHLALPGNIPDFLAYPLLALEQRSCDPRRVAVSLSRFHQYSAGMAVAGFGNSASFLLVAA